MTPSLSDFIEFPFPEQCDIVYILYFAKPGKQDAPFYVGESSRHIGRFGDYISAKFSASTDFKVGEAVKYLRQIGYLVIIRYKVSTMRRHDQDSLIVLFKSNGYELLNDLKGYAYKTANAEEELGRIHGFVRIIVGRASEILDV